MSNAWGISITVAPGFWIGPVGGGSINVYPSSIGVKGQPFVTFQGINGVQASYTFWGEKPVAAEIIGLADGWTPADTLGPGTTYSAAAGGTATFNYDANGNLISIQTGLTPSIGILASKTYTITWQQMLDGSITYAESLTNNSMTFPQQNATSANYLYDWYEQNTLVELPSALGSALPRVDSGAGEVAPASGPLFKGDILRFRPTERPNFVAL